MLLVHMDMERGKNVQIITSNDPAFPSKNNKNWLQYWIQKHAIKSEGE